MRHLLEERFPETIIKCALRSTLSIFAGGQPWTETYERPMKDVFALQSEITHAVAARLQARLSPNETVALN